MTELLLDACSSPEHQIIFRTEDGWDEVYMDFHLTTNRGFWKRLWYGLRYAFGYRSRYGAWDEFILTGQQHIDTFQKVIDQLKEVEERFKKKERPDGNTKGIA